MANANANATTGYRQTNTNFHIHNKPTAPVNTKLPASESRVSDPSSTTPKGRSYPIPSFFEYRAKPKEYDFK